MYTIFAIKVSVCSFEFSISTPKYFKTYMGISKNLYVLSIIADMLMQGETSSFKWF